jgi:hypothetical protein
MFHLLLRPILLLTLLIALPIALIRAQLYDDSDLRAFLTPPDCPAPCFMGIRPGVTTTEEAIAILEAHEWVAEVDDVDPDLFRDPDGDGAYLMPTIGWMWSQTRPEWIDGESKGVVWIGEDGLVLRLEILTSVPMGDILLALGNPDRISLDSYVNMFGHMWFQDSWYVNNGLLVMTAGFCPLRRLDSYSQQTLIYFTHLTSESQVVNTFDDLCEA